MSISKQKSHANSDCDTEQEYWTVDDFHFGCALSVLLGEQAIFYQRKSSDKKVAIKATAEALALVDQFHRGPLLVDLKKFLPQYHSLIKNSSYPIIPFDEF